MLVHFLDGGYGPNPVARSSPPERPESLRVFGCLPVTARGAARRQAPAHTPPAVSSFEAFRTAGESVTTAVRRAAEERLQRVRRRQSGRSLAAEILEIGKRCAALPDLDARTADELLGYDEYGLPR